MTTTPEIELLDVVTPDTESSTQEAPVLITEQQVAFGTAAAVPVAPARKRRLAAAVHKLSAALTPDPREPRRHYAKRYDFLEHAAMAREMGRL
ncbi:hypothetical protein H7K24_09475 [Mycobacterium fragae]|jgi:hypothetical protein|uniref:Uncharacterized protein n=1 Tax=Mycobacterium fragae TaxID=1260918 RepID=A0A1X1V598_9MYCO|nr:hypothetical protein [Mycobacterium fragae]MCV7400385.1 hypothetical protein [Mycobacterium fragae]ORV64276.1 hypothetical protein AWC06_06940 [Mycobacterium fragae]